MLIAQGLTIPASRESLLNTMGQHEPLTKQALMTILEREDFIKTSPILNHTSAPVPSNKNNLENDLKEIENHPTIVDELIQKNQLAIEELKQTIITKSGTPLIEFIKEDIQRLKSILFDPQSTKVFKTAMDASSWINEKMELWLGEKNTADMISQFAANNITAEMGLELLDVADVIRPYPAIIEYLKGVNEDTFFSELIHFEGGKEARDAIYDFLSKYGMRCSGEIDITKPRWSENPAALVPMILSNLHNFKPLEKDRKLKQGNQQALNKEHELISRLRQLPDGLQKANETRRMIRFIRNFIGYREYPKYGMINRYFIYKQALLKEAERLVQANVIHDKEDIFYLTFDELREVVHTHKLEQQLISERKEEYKFYEKLTPPRVLTSDGEALTGEYKRENLPAGAIAGLPVSSGVIEGRARIVLNMEDAELEDGDILVTSFTDPSWTPLFLAIKGLVTEVGGLMTHGAVIAREYGLPAIVGVENATTLIKDGQRIRVHGTDGYIELL